ncbi:MAG: hypothetical protein QMC80_06550 [Thermoplasmatales archaeon]|nr:hypothetical protein [Thermoplasmatales archaeon]
MKRKHKTIHEKTTRAASIQDPTEKELIKKARKMFNRMKRRKSVQRKAERADDIIIKFDLIGTPEVSFAVIMGNNELKFSTDRLSPDLAVGIHKKWFIKLIEQPNHSNPKVIMDNICLRKGNVRDFKRFKSICLETLFKQRR